MPARAQTHARPHITRIQAIAIGVPLAGGMAGGFATASEVNGWYKTLRRPSWTPP